MSLAALPRLEPDPLPLPGVGRPPRHRLCPEGTPPIGLEFLGAKATTGGYLLPCPACVQGWCLLVPDGQPYGYSISLQHGCSRGCAGPDIAWWHAWRCMDLPPEPAVVPDQKGRRYAVAAVRGEMRRLLELRPADPVRGLSAVAFKAGQFMAATGFDQDIILSDLLRVAAGLGAEPAAVRASLAQALAAGQAKPRSAPA